MQVTWCKVCYLRWMWGTEWSITYHGKDVRLICFGLQCEDMHRHVSTPHLQRETRSIFLIPIHVVKFHSKNWNLLLCLLLNAMKHFASHKSCFHRLSSCGATWPLFFFVVAVGAFSFYGLLWSVVLRHGRVEHLAKRCWRNEGCKLSVNLWLITFWVKNA